MSAGARARPRPRMRQGESFPLGAWVQRGGTNFSVFSKSATLIELLLFDRVDDAEPATVIKLDPGKNRTYHYWHVCLPGIRTGQIYAYRAHGPFDPARGFRFDPQKVLLDPYGRAVVVPPHYDKGAASIPGDNTPYAMKNVVVDTRDYDWEGDSPLKHPFDRTIIYEMHVRGFTAHPSSGVSAAKRGTYAGLIEKIPYLKDLGITAVELMPVFQFDPFDAPLGHVNYWGYCPVGFFAPHTAYSSDPTPIGALNEFRDMVKALHRADIEVILDVVFNHTAEGDHTGPTLSFRGLENNVYYTLDETDKARYANYTGTGNTLNANQPIVRRMILDSLRYWVREMHIDGFRFDLASILCRDEKGKPLENPPVIWDIESDPILAGTKLIAEAWDAGGLYHVGTFVGDTWQEWNGRFRDDIRSFMRGDCGTVTSFASRILGSPDIYSHKEREPEQSINFVTCHDGFTLNDLVSYDKKHNEDNGEDNRDGSDDNRSWNCGVEGPTEDPAIERLRNRQIKNFLAITLLALGTPMVLMGDEMRRTQRGNNNAYCQDNELSWVDWTLLKKHWDIHRFLQRLVDHRLAQRPVTRGQSKSLSQLLLDARFQWHGVKRDQPDWGYHSHSLALTAHLRRGRVVLHLMVNAYWEPLEFELPEIGRGANGGWRRWIDTYLDPPRDICDWSEAEQVEGSAYRVQARSLAVLLQQLPARRRSRKEEGGPLTMPKT